MTTVTVGGFSSYSAPRVSSERVVTSDRVVRSRLRMTKRGRAVLLTLVSVPLVAATLLLGLNAGAATGTSSSTPLAKVTVVGGETLWGVAKQIAPNADPRDVIAAIEDVNQLQTADIQPGQQLNIPAQYSQH